MINVWPQLASHIGAPFVSIGPRSPRRCYRFGSARLRSASPGSARLGSVARVLAYVVFWGSGGCAITTGAGAAGGGESGMNLAADTSPSLDSALAKLRKRAESWVGIFKSFECPQHYFDRHHDDVIRWCPCPPAEGVATTYLMEFCSKSTAKTRLEIFIMPMAPSSERV